MKTYAYYRHSTDKQDERQQLNTIKAYTEANDITVNEVCGESEHGDVDYTKRELGSLIERCNEGDIIIASEASRLSRSMDVSFSLIRLVKEKNIFIHIVSEGFILSRDGNEMQYLQMFISASAAEKELKHNRSRTKSALMIRKALIDENGGFVSKSGNWCTKLGNPTGKGLDKARDTYAKTRAERQCSDRIRMTYAFLVELRASGLKLNECVERLNKAGFKTITGLKFKHKASVSQIIALGKKKGW